MYCVYWIKTEDHQDVYSQGYVGITKNICERWRAHKKNNRKTALTSAASKYGWDNLECVVLESGLTQERALELENKYRPVAGVGWNLQAGGHIGVESEWYSDPDNAKKHSEATKVGTRKGLLKDTKEDRAARARESWADPNRKQISLTGSNNPRAQLTEEQVRDIKYALLPAGLSYKDIAEFFGVRPHVVQFIATRKNWKHI